jgi:cytoskeletal protein CcmA (bactofilin family)
MSSKLRVNEIHPYQGNDIQVSGSLRISGSGPSKISLEVFGDITASGVITGKEFIVESITSSRIFAEGSSQFGNTLDDKHSFSGSISSPITASHDVSSSSGTGSFQHVYVAEDLDVDGTTSLTNLEVVHITASGDISASSQTATHILGGDNVTFDLQGNQIFKLSGNLTASGDISSSTGDVYAKDFYIGNDQFTDETTVDNHFAIGASGDSGILLTNITASGDISSSGTIIANNFRSSAGGDTEPDLGGINFNDHMILHGQLTASQNISQSEGFTGSFGSIRVPARCCWCRRTYTI